MNLYWIFFSLLTIANASQSYTAGPDQGTVEPTPYTTETSTVTKSDKVEIVVKQRFMSVAVVSNCGAPTGSSSSSNSSSPTPTPTPSSSQSSSVGTSTVPVF